MNINAESVTVDRTPELHPLSDREMEQLSSLLRDPSNPTAHDLLLYGGARTVAGLMARLVIAEPLERRVLLTAIRRALDNARS